MVEELGFSTIGSFCKATGLDQSVVGLFVNLKKSPLNVKTGQWTKTAIDLAGALGAECDDVWTVEQRTMNLESNSSDFHMSARDIAGLVYGDRVAIDHEIEDGDTKRIVDEALSTLSPRESKILRMRFGIGEYNRTHTLEEIGQIYDVHRERIRNIEAKAIRKLRHPKIAVAIKESGVI